MQESYTRGGYTSTNAIKDLSDEQLQKLGVVKIGWQKNIRQAAQKY